MPPLNLLALCLVALPIPLAGGRWALDQFHPSAGLEGIAVFCLGALLAELVVNAVILGIGLLLMLLARPEHQRGPITTGASER